MALHPFLQSKLGKALSRHVKVFWGQFLAEFCIPGFSTERWPQHCSLTPQHPLHHLHHLLLPPFPMCPPPTAWHFEGDPELLEEHPS